MLQIGHFTLHGDEYEISKYRRKIDMDEINWVLDVIWWNANNSLYSTKGKSNNYVTPRYVQSLKFTKNFIFRVKFQDDALRHCDERNY